MRTLHKWDSFLHTADCFIITYATSSYTVGATSLFTIGHAVELYLKSANTKITGDIERAISFGHRLKDLWDDCKEKDNKFMPSYELKDNLFCSSFLEEDIYSQLCEADIMHFIRHQHLYIILKHLADLKYLGAPLKSIKKPYAITFSSHDPYWVSFFNEFRTFLNYPDSDSLNYIQYAIKHGDLNPKAVSFLKYFVG